MKRFLKIIIVFALGLPFLIISSSRADDIGQTGFDPTGIGRLAGTDPAAFGSSPYQPGAWKFEYQSPWFRYEDDWELIATEELSVSVPEGDHLGICFDPGTEELSITDPTVILSDIQQQAIARAPAWLRFDLYDNFRRFEFSMIADFVAQEILNAPDPYVDEVAFQAAHISPTLLGGQMYLELLLENAQWVYAVDSSLAYVQIVDYGDSNDDDYYSTAVYRMIAENGDTIEVEIDKEKYYWFVMHPKLSDELPTYIDPSTGEPADPPTGVFWRTWLWNYADPGYPLYSNLWDSCQFLWDRTNNATDALDIVNQWIDDVMEWNVGSERPIQPVRIYALHMGYCGEHQDLRAAAGRIALIPTACTSNICEDHVWNEFWDGDEWIHWDGGSINDPLMYENSWGKVLSAVYNWRGDGWIWTVTERYSADVCTLHVTITDSLGKPADGERITVYSDYYYGGVYYTTWGITNGWGEVSFLLGDSKNYYVRVDGPLGGYPEAAGWYVNIITASQPNQAYFWEHAMDDATPNLEINPAQEYPNPLDEYRIEISYSVDFESVYGAFFSCNGAPVQFAKKMDTGYTNFFVVNGENFDAYSSFQPAEGFGIALGMTAGTADFILPTDEPWYGMFSSRGFSIDRPKVSAVVNVYRNLTPVEGEFGGDNIPAAYHLDSPYPNPFNRAVTIPFEAPSAGRVKVAVYDLQGREISVLLDDDRLPGGYTVQWKGMNKDGGIVSTGVYIVTMQTSDERFSRKICYLK